MVDTKEHYYKALLQACIHLQNTTDICPKDLEPMPESWDCLVECVNGKEHICWKNYFIRKIN